MQKNITFMWMGKRFRAMLIDKLMAENVGKTKEYPDVGVRLYGKISRQYEILPCRCAEAVYETGSP